MDQETGAINDVNTKIDTRLGLIDESLGKVNSNVTSLANHIGNPAFGQETVFKELDQIKKVNQIS